jgi:hypothetical protein
MNMLKDTAGQTTQHEPNPDRFYTILVEETNLVPHQDPLVYTSSAAGIDPLYFSQKYNHPANDLKIQQQFLRLCPHRITKIDILLN